MSLRIATVKYLNSLPFLDALKKLEHLRMVDLLEAIPSNCADLLYSGKVDLALIPVGSIADFEELYLISDYCISCDGSVRTVKLFSKHPIDEIQQIVLDASSRSSNLLIQILCRDYWKKPEIIFTNKENEVTSLNTGFLKIGDEVFNLEHRFKFEFDLGQYWKLLTGLPFVFAVWVSKTKIDDSNLKMLNDGFHSSLLNIPKIIENYLPLNKINIEGYFDKNIYYELNEEKKTGLLKFLELAGLQNPILNI